MCVNERLIFRLLDSELWEDDFSSMVDLNNISELRKARFYDKNLVFHSPSLRFHLGNWVVG